MIEEINFIKKICHALIISVVKNNGNHGTW